MTIAITKVGSKAKIVSDGYDVQYFELSAVNLIYNTSRSTIDVKVGDSDSYPPTAIANVTIGGVVITDQTVFDTQVAEVFPNAGGSAITTLDDVTQGSTNKYLSAADYTIVQQIITSFTS